MSVAALLELRFKSESVAEATEVFRRELVVTRALAGHVRTEVLVDPDDDAHWIIHLVWESVEAEQAYTAFRAGEGKITELPGLLAAPPVKTIFTVSDI
ncbi:antibiotic biosynthesis monooxygenase [Mycolicibacterium sp. P9-64]|uniref:putative quinol monooxygenase n=1 Tax=Mycolicibacterium sp. P9-64 TaxID=2024612 RepID=UPI0011EFAF92|nr:antibiotic biosynthesis monooxygenase family protein [Mycolicibacterium sp. P9-64]KAA0085955.1 antibiotic biosynthesis monooxygenase [Mycolicibacterium sp. P9-64]